MAFVNLPPNFQDIFAKIDDRISKLETGPNQAMYTAVTANVVAVQALNEASQALAQATQAYNVGSQALIKDSNTITNASNQLTGINGNGITVYAGTSSTSGARVVLNSAGLTGFNSSGTATFAINASTGAVSTVGALFTSSTIYGGELNINGNAIISPLGYLTATGATITGTITATSGSFAGSITSTSGTIGGFTIGSNFLSSSAMSLGAATGQLTTSGLISANGGLNASSGIVLSGGALSMGTNNINNAGTVGCSTLSSSGTVSAGTSISASTTISAGTTITSTSAATQTTTAATNCYITTGGTFTRTSNTSSQRYKENITDITNVPELDPRLLLELPVRAYTYKEGHIPDGDDRASVVLPGFIAEELDAIYPVAVDYEGGEVETWNGFWLIPAMLSLIQNQEARIQELESKIQ